MWRFLAALLLLFTLAVPIQAQDEEEIAPAELVSEEEPPISLPADESADEPDVTTDPVPVPTQTPVIIVVTATPEATLTPAPPPAQAAAPVNVTAIPTATIPPSPTATVRTDDSKCRLREITITPRDIRAGFAANFRALGFLPGSRVQLEVVPLSTAGASVVPPNSFEVPPSLVVGQDCVLTGRIRTSGFDRDGLYTLRISGTLADGNEGSITANFQVSR